jgi:nucleotide-binding universal stress UspA family protein
MFLGYRVAIMVVLVPYDGSPSAQKAVKHAVGAAGDEQIILLRVVEVADGMIDAGLDIVKERIKESQTEGLGEVPEEIMTPLDAEDVEYQVETVVGKPGREIVSFAEEHEVSQIVMGSHGREGVSRALLGSIAENVVRRAPTTVTVVR